jgi:hypothetical protein
MANRITFDCPQLGAQAPAVFSVSGAYFADFPSNTVKCVLTYIDANMQGRNQCIICIVDESVNPASWCGRFDVSAAPPANNGAMSLAATLFDSTGAAIAGPIIKTVNYSAGAADPCSCSGAGTAC